MPILKFQTWAGLPKSTKKDIVESLTRETTRILGCPTAAVTVIIEEIPKENWGASGELCSERFPDTPQD